MKLIAQSASADGTSGIPKWFICRSRLAVELEAELVAAVGEQDEVDGERADEVADDGAGRALVRGRRRAATVAPTVISTFARLASDERDRALLDAEERGQLLVVHLRPEADEAGADEPRVVAELQRVRRSASARTQPTTSPAVAIAIVNQNDVRTTSVRCAVVLRVEVEAEERARDPQPQDDRRAPSSARRSSRSSRSRAGRGSSCRAAAGGRRGSARRARRGRRSPSACRAA